MNVNGKFILFGKVESERGLLFFFDPGKNR